MVGMVGMVRIRLRARKSRFYHSDSTIPISTTPFRFCHSDFDNTRGSPTLRTSISPWVPGFLKLFMSRQKAFDPAGVEIKEKAA